MKAGSIPGPAAAQRQMCRPLMPHVVVLATAPQHLDHPLKTSHEAVSKLLDFVGQVSNLSVFAVIRHSPDGLETRPTCFETGS